MNRHVDIKGNSASAPQEAQWMPVEAPLEMPEQEFWKNSFPKQELPFDPSARIWRFIVIGGAFLTSIGFIFWLESWLRSDGLSVVESLLLLLMGVSFFWIMLSVGTAIAGLFARKASKTEQNPSCIPSLDVAIIMPICEEPVERVFRNLQIMIADIDRVDSRHNYVVHILSDSSSLEHHAAEEAAFLSLRAAFPKWQIGYRRREVNTDRKAGNLSDWVRRWGAAYEAMLVLDADSLMSANAINALVNEMASDERAGLIQTAPKLIGAQTIFARAQRFANAAYGEGLARGLAQISGRSGNYWGHNAVIRIPAFAASAALPPIKEDRHGRQILLSHDFVEAALLRRSGWAVRLLPEVSGSFEETPPHLIDHVLRDRRWCRGNLQHLRILAAYGFHPMSRFHLLHGAVSYLLSPGWFLLMIIWALAGTGEGESVITYFSGIDPYPDWPEPMLQSQGVSLLVIMYAVLLVPKLLGLMQRMRNRKQCLAFGGAHTLLAGAMVELIVAIIVAPILMVQQSKAALRAMLFRSSAWAPQRRSSANEYTAMDLLRFHFVETFCGVLLLSGMMAGLVSLWLLPIALSLALATMISYTSSLEPSWARILDALPHERIPPAVLRAFQQAQRSDIKGPKEAIPAQTKLSPAQTRMKESDAHPEIA